MGFVRRIVNLYRTQVELLWRWRSGRRALIKRTLVALVASVIAFNITAWLLPQLDINELGGGLIAVLVISVLNLLVCPGDSGARGQPLGRCAGGPDAALPGARHPPGGAVGPGHHRRWRDHRGAHHLVRLRRHRRSHRPALRARRGRVLLRHAGADARGARRPDVNRTSDPGLVVIQLDGLSHDVLSHSLRAGRVPEMARWIPDGYPQTRSLGRPAAVDDTGQPGGHPPRQQRRHPELPLAREGGRAILVANHPEDATVIESRVSNGEGLLSMGGASISNIFTGDGDRAFL